jgi:hypothetical protein
MLDNGGPQEFHRRGAVEGRGGFVVSASGIAEPNALGIEQLS